MKVFISWSGERSRLLAEALHTWLRIVIQSIDPWMSKADIYKGARWSAELASELEQTQFGIICLTPDNINKPWILFEAGALSKAIPNNTYVCPVLFDLQPSDLEGPLAQFQATIIEKDDLRNLIRTINDAQQQDALPTDRLNKAFELAWPEFDKQLSQIPTVPLAERHERALNEMVREILERIRADERNSEARESAFNKVRDSMMSFIMNFFQIGLKNATLPPEIAKNFEEWVHHTSSYLNRRDISSCPDCLGTGWMVVPNKGTIPCEHKALDELESNLGKQNENSHS